MLLKSKKTLIKVPKSDPKPDSSESSQSLSNALGADLSGSNRSVSKQGSPKQERPKQARPKQLKLVSRDRTQEGPFGGSLLKNSHAKTKRPFAPRATMHITLKTNGYGRMLKRGRRARIDRIVTLIAKTNRVHLIRFANVGNHLHLLLSCREKDRLTGFLRGISGAIARMIKSEERQTQDKSNTASEKFWLQRPWSRIVASRGRPFKTVSRYVDLNSIESWGFSRHSSLLIWDQRYGHPL